MLYSCPILYPNRGRFHPSFPMSALAQNGGDNQSTGVAVSLLFIEKIVYIT